MAERKSKKSLARRLPIHDFQDDIVADVRRSKALVVVGYTGSGKTTQLPQFLYKAGFSKHGMIGVTQPRRVAALSVAARVAQEMKCTLGREVGYQVRFDDCTSQDTQIKYMTDGCLLREFLDDRELSRYSVIILDEAHERSLDTDILFGLMKEKFLREEEDSTRRHQLKVVVMSATLDSGKFSKFFNSCPVFEIPGKLFPVKDVYCNMIKPEDVKNPSYCSQAVRVVMDIHTDQPQGDILVFLTGQAEIEKTCDILYKKSEELDYREDVRDPDVTSLLILPVYGSMPTEQQQRIFSPADSGVRKCIVATNIAGTSLTIDGIRYVVDSGFVKQLSYNPRTGLDTLQVVPISKSEAIQRAGRAGRTAPGRCYRLYNRECYDQCMPEDMLPEIQRTSLTSVVLSLKSMGIHNVLRFHYLDPPEERMLLEALKQLFYFDAIDRSGRVTPLGRLLVQYPLPPGLARAVISSGSHGCQDLLLPIAAMLSVENVFIRPAEGKKQTEAQQCHQRLADLAGGSNDFTTLLTVFQKCKESDSPARWCRENYIHWRGVKMALSIHQQLQGILDKQTQSADFPRQELAGSQSELLRRALCDGFFNHIARRSATGRSFRTMDGHASTVFIHPSSVLFGEEAQLDWVIFHEVVWTSKVYMRTVCPVRYSWVQDLLPKLHQLDLSSLSGCQLISDEPTPTAQDVHKPLLGGQEASSSLVPDVSKLAKRNDDSSISEARLRYLQRKEARGKAKR
ncbi:putative ATP-dependent RNA helicase DHX40 isoform X1 [Branchiostoma floridae x Branchiostoma japonicum]